MVCKMIGLVACNKMSMYLKRISAMQRWLLLSLIPLGMFILYTLLVNQGGLAVLTVHQEQWLLQRPVTRFDCVVYQWRYLGEAPASLLLMLVICIACWRLKYRLRVAFVLLVLLGVGLGVEYLGKQYIVQPAPIAFEGGLNSLGCPQIWQVSKLKRIPLSLGMWWVAPDAPSFRVAEGRAAATAAFSMDANSNEDYYAYTGYPSGHAYRWMMIGLVALWLTWRQVRKRFLRRLLMLVSLVLAFAGGFGQFFIGAHLLTDMLGGYLLGAFLACCAIAVLRASETRNRWTREGYSCDLSALPIAENSDKLLPEKL
jgi:membrane-associated phospholipid phosphatase